ncbi:MAG: hypothetical protein IKG42_00640 [Clostridia bacterium]|nr:hypothetical protein [Clostridia bacterium]
MSVLLNGLNELPCNMEHDLKNGIITVESISAENVDQVSNLIDSNYDVEKLEIINQTAFDEKEETSISKSSENNVLPNIPNSGKKYSDFIEDKLSWLFKALNGAIANTDATEKDIADILDTATNLFQMRYFNSNKLKANIGDIVTCNFGAGLSGEICGKYVTGVVTHILGWNMVYVIPFTKALSKTITPSPHIPYNFPENGTVDMNGIFLITKGCYIRIERINSIKGVVTPEYLKKLQSLMVEKLNFGKKSATKKLLTDEVSSTEKVAQKKRGKEEIELLKIIQPALEQIVPGNSMEEISNFTSNIGLLLGDEIENNEIKSAFFNALSIPKITMESVTVGFSYSKTTQDTLRRIFKLWLSKKTDDIECHRISFTTMLKLFKEYYYR